MFDLMIIGGGPAGYVAAERAGAQGLSTILFEKRELGGVCLNEGCIPTKTMLYSAKVYDTARHGDKYGVFAPEATFDFKKIADRKTRVVRRLVAGIGAKMRNFNVTVVKGDAMIEGRDAEGITVTCGGESYKGRNLLVATGSEAFVPPIEGLAEAGDKVMTNREILALKERPASLVIIGGGVIGMEFASLYNSLGTEVTVVEMLPEILGGLDPELSAMLRGIYEKRGVKFNLSCRVVRIEGGKVFFVDTEGNELVAEGERILVSVGRRPVLKGFGLENLGVEVERGIKVDERMRTSVEGVWAAGDVTGFSLLAHTASREGEVVVNNILGRDDRMSYKAIPGVVYTNPEIAGVGLTEQSAAAKGVAVKVQSLPMAYAGRFVAENEMGVGVCKVLTDEASGAVVGVHMLGNPSSEMIYGACMAIEAGMTPEQLEKVVFPHPTVSEIFKEVAATF